MENKRAKQPAAGKPRVARSVSDSVGSSQRTSVKPRPNAHQQPPTASRGKKPVSADQKHGVVGGSRPTSTTSSEPRDEENERWTTLPNASFTVLVRVILAAAKWLKISKKRNGRRTPLSKSLSLPPPPQRPV